MAWPGLTATACTGGVGLEAESCILSMFASPTLPHKAKSLLRLHDVLQCYSRLPDALAGVGQAVYQVCTSMPLTVEAE